MGAMLELACCFNQTALYVYCALIPALALFVIVISFKVFLYHSSIQTMEGRLLDRKVKKLTQKVGKSSDSEGAKGNIPVAIDPLVNTDSTNKNHMGDRIPLHLVHGRVPPSAAAAAAAAAGPAAIPPAAISSGAPASGPASEEPLSPRTPSRDPATNDEVTEISGYNTQTASDYGGVNVSPEGARPKLPDMSDLPSISTIDGGSDIDTTITSLTSSQMTSAATTTTSGGTTSPASTLSRAKKDDDRTDTLKMMDDPIFGLKTEILSPDGNTRSELSNDPFQTYTVPASMLRDEKPPQRSNLMPTPSDASDSAMTTHPVTNPHLAKTTAAPPSARSDNLPEYTPPDHSPVTTRTPPVPASKTAPETPVATPVKRPSPTYRRFPESSATTTDPIFTPPRGAMSERRERQDLFDVPARSSQQSPQPSFERERSDRQYSKPSGYFSQRAKAWLADNRDSDSVEEK